MYRFGASHASFPCPILFLPRTTFPWPAFRNAETSDAQFFSRTTIFFCAPRGIDSRDVSFTASATQVHPQFFLLCRATLPDPQCVYLSSSFAFVEIQHPLTAILSPPDPPPYPSLLDVFLSEFPRPLVSILSPSNVQMCFRLVFVQISRWSDGFKCGSHKTSTNCPNIHTLIATQQYVFHPPRNPVPVGI
jgi:hypothetical protein